MEIYLDLLRRIMTDGVGHGDRTGTGTRSIFGHQMRSDLTEGFPLLTVKRMHARFIFGELLWFLRGDANIAWLRENRITIWDEWADENDNPGPIYNYQWHFWLILDGRHVGQLTGVVESLCSNPEFRRHVVSTWNVADVDVMALPPCHALLQFYVTDGKLSYQLYQRSVDVFLGVPFNITSYALLTHLVAQVAGLDVEESIYTLGDTHIYHNHFNQVTGQPTRQPRALPRLVLSPGVREIDRLEPPSITVEDYDLHPAIRAPMAVQGALLREIGRSSGTDREGSGSEGLSPVRNRFWWSGDALTTGCGDLPTVHEPRRVYGTCPLVRADVCTVPARRWDVS